jgi:hypothetical protein
VETEEPEPRARKRWYESLWVTLFAGYLFAPLGLYLMWRYQDWPLWLKTGLTVFGLAMWVGGTYVSSAYITPRIL